MAIEGVANANANANANNNNQRRRRNQVIRTQNMRYGFTVPLLSFDEFLRRPMRSNARSYANVPNEFTGAEWFDFVNSYDHYNQVYYHLRIAIQDFDELMNVIGDNQRFFNGFVNQFTERDEYEYRNMQNPDFTALRNNVRNSIALMGNYYDQCVNHINNIRDQWMHLIQY